MAGSRLNANAAASVTVDHTSARNAPSIGPRSVSRLTPTTEPSLATMVPATLRVLRRRARAGVESRRWARDR